MKFSFNIWKEEISLAVLLAGAIITVKATQPLPPDSTSARILQAKPGASVELPEFAFQKSRQLSYRKLVLPGPQFLISDDPEYIRVPEAAVFRERVLPGTVRFYLYNVNGVKEPQKMDRKITALIKNLGSGPMRLQMLKYSAQPPSGDYLKIGSQGLADYFASQPSPKVRQVKAGQAVALDEKWEKTTVRYDDLVHGFYEFLIDQPAEITVLQTDPGTPGPTALARNPPVLPGKSKSGAGRGVFGVSNYRVQLDSVFDTRHGAAEITVADGQRDPWVEGTASHTTETAVLKGNYGVLYDINIRWRSTDGRGLALLTRNARGGGPNNNWCGAMATSVVVSAGLHPGGIVKLPSDKAATKKEPEAVVIQVFAPSADGQEQLIHLTYSPPGASCLPTPITLVPVQMNAK
ncbi:copper amine oxidase [Hymenobacter aquaticus]|uniref:Copper amine oxidase n=1 Tax=Hymenobacter aquaticus TaxID=1867101 RepID=A0A4Z0Q9T0_9BACT|nr:copper amine oxidase [Hymenobacter aquaticus]TGE25811.1 copper amine oxidase [Hymenobacter aquaticus]